MWPVLLGISGLAVVAAVSVFPSLEACAQGAGPPATTVAMDRPETVSFSMDVFPILKGRCIDCHQPGGMGYEASGLDLTTYEGLMKGTKHGPMVIPGSTLSSNLLRIIDWTVSVELQMPHGAARRLSTCDRSIIRTWIWEGARNN
jgi:mono/diheme cytochrome c family protein